MRKGEKTRERIVEKAAAVFNQQGYAGASMSTIMEATGLKKGGIYGHFQSKDELALEAFDHAFRRVSDAFTAALAGRHHAVDRLVALLDVFRAHVTDGIIPGGCPLLNMAVETDDGHPVLRERAQEALRQWQALIGRIVARGVEHGELRADADGEAVATLTISLLEGAVMMSRLLREPVHMERTLDFLTAYVHDQLAA